MMAIDFAGLKRLAEQSAAVAVPCSCHDAALLAWRAVPVTLELDQFEEVATLVDDPFDEPTFAEYHPHGTRYDSDDAPIAPRYFPCNRFAVASAPRITRKICRRSSSTPTRKRSKPIRSKPRLRAA